MELLGDKFRFTSRHRLDPIVGYTPNGAVPDTGPAQRMVAGLSIIAKVGDGAMEMEEILYIPTSDADISWLKSQFSTNGNVGDLRWYLAAGTVAMCPA